MFLLHASPVDDNFLFEWWKSEMSLHKPEVYEPLRSRIVSIRFDS